jgi:hypothetical protein
MPEKSRRPWWPVAVAAVAVLAAALAGLATGPEPWLDTGDKIASVAGLAVAVAGLVVGLRATRRGTPDPVTDPARAADELARQVSRHWQQEAGRRGLRHLDPIRLHWSPTGRPVAPDPGVVIGAPRVTRLRVPGDSTGLAAAYAGLPGGQVVVLGAPGGGKSTLTVLLVLDLLAARTPGSPVPVLVTLPSWDPEREPFDTWLPRRIAELHPATTPEAAATLLAARLIVPVLDAFDELAEPARHPAVDGLNAALGRDRPFVLTSRPDEYETAIRAAGTPLGGAPVVELDPVTGADATAYLAHGQLDGAARWGPVLAAMRADPDGPAARALHTPLMVYLARTAYATVDPAGLLTFTDAAAVEQHLLRTYLPTVYSRRHPDRRPYSPEQAEQWLTFAAGHLSRERSADLAWWRLVRVLPWHRRLFRSGVGAAGVVALGSPAWLGLGLAFGWPVAAACAAVTGVAAGLVTAAHGDDPWWPDMSPRRARAELATLIRVAPFALLVFAMAAVLGERLYGAVAGSAMIVTALAWTARSPDAAATVTPSSTLSHDRFTALLGGLGFGAVTVAAAWLSPAGPIPAVSAGLALGVVGMMMTAGWPWFVVTRLVLAVRGQLPWRLMAFLEDASERGVLRRNGATYQFRHARLQDFLARRDVR